VVLKTLGPVVLAFILVLAGTPFVRKIAIKYRVLDKPTDRKVHKKLMPRLGGLAICLGFWAAVLLTQQLTREVAGLLTGGLLICLVGVWDDYRSVSPRVKLVFQVAAAAIVIAMGVRVDFVTNPAGGIFSLYYLSYPVTILWIIGVTNAVNLIDGLDGLAAGVSAIAAVTLGIVSFIEGFGQIGMLSFILAAGALGFLKYNFYPAKIFMGDTGALFLGFNLAVLAIMGLTKSTTVVSVFLPVVILGIPIIDTMLAIVRRFFSRKPIFSADKEHLHHRLLAIGLTHRRTVLTIYGVSILLGLSAVLMTQVTTAQGMLIMIAVTLGVFYAADKVGILRDISAKKAAAVEKDM